MRHNNLSSGLALGIALVFFIGLGITAINPALGQELVDKTREEIPEPEEVEEVEPGDIPTDFTLEDMDGVEFTLSDVLGEMPIVIDFWATWCGPCVREIPLLNEFAMEYEGEVMVIGVTSEAEESRDTVLEFIEEHEVTYRIFQDPSRETSGAYLVRAIPLLIVIGEDGVVAATHLGYSESVIEHLIEDLGLEEDIEEDEE